MRNYLSRYSGNLNQWGSDKFKASIIDDNQAMNTKSNLKCGTQNEFLWPHESTQKLNIQAIVSQETESATNDAFKYTNSLGACW